MQIDTERMGTKRLAGPQEAHRSSPDLSTRSISSDRAGAGRLWLLTLSESEARPLWPGERLSDEPTPVVDFAWSPDGRTLALVISEGPDRRARLATLPNPDVLVIGGNADVLSQREPVRTRLLVLDPTSGETRDLTPPGLNVSADMAEFSSRATLAWSPDGSRIAFGARPVSIVSGNVGRGDDIYSIDVQTSSLVGRERGRPARDHWPAWSPRGDRLATLSHEPVGTYSDLKSIILYGAAPEQAEKLPLNTAYISTRCGLQWAPGGRAILFCAQQGSNRVLVSADIATGSERRLTPADRSVSEFTLTRDGATLVVLMGNGNAPHEIFELPLRAAGSINPKRLTDFAALLRDMPLATVESIRWRSRDDRFDIEGLLVKPPGFTPARRYPLLVHLHGGPGSTHQNTFTDLNTIFGPAHLYAQLGFLMLFPNPRGDSGYSTEFAEAFRAKWGDEWALDIEPGIDELIARGWVDAERMAVIGHSYGAYLTAVVTTKTNRFKAASFSDGMVNLTGDYVSKWPDFDEFYAFYFGGNHVEKRREYYERSPFFAVERVKTPTLVRAGNLRAGYKTYGMADQAKQWFGGLRINDTPAIMILHNDEGHGIRSSSTYADYVERNVRWLRYWVLGQGENPLERSDAGS